MKFIIKQILAKTMSKDARVGNFQIITMISRLKNYKFSYYNNCAEAFKF